jgi:site-specific recombinase XerC
VNAASTAPASAVLTRYLTRAEEKTLLATIKATRGDLAERDFYVMEALRCTGLRITAFSGLSVGDAVAALKTRYLQPDPSTQKRHREQRVFVSQRLDRALRGLLRVRKRMNGLPGLDEALVIGRRGTRLTVRSYQLRTKYWLNKAGLQIDATPHFWRHTLAIRTLETSTADNPLLVVQQALNHASLNTTAHYLKPTREQMETDLERASR